jgi:hypothetical protein
VKARLLDILAVVSILIVGLLALGFVGDAQVMVSHGYGLRASAGLQQVELGVDRGRVKSYWTSSPNPLAPSKFLGGRVQLWPPRAPEVKRSIWEFDAHVLSTNTVWTIFILAFPIWCAMVPFSIAPAFWLRKRRKKRGISLGFAVEQVTEQAPQT